MTGWFAQLPMTADAEGLWHNAKLLPTGDPERAVMDGAMVVRAGRIQWIGARSALPERFADLPRHDAGGRWITPGLVDCHTHLVFAGQRADEFALRLQGATYEDIARRGGGIVSTVRATRAASENELYEASSTRLQALLAEGVTAVEIKSGYGLDFETERKQLRVARRLGRHYPVSVYTTFLGAHALPPEYAGRADEYIDHIAQNMLPALAAEGLVDAVDVFCERIGFTPSQTERVFAAATRLGLPLKIHAEQLSNSGGAQLAARYRALSADHLEHLDEAGVAALREAGTVAVLLPGAFYFLRETKLPPLDLLRRYEVPVALATDANPGSAPTTSLLLMLNLACTLLRMTVAEALTGVTRHAARALGQAHRHGVLEADRQADFVVWDIETAAELAYWFGRNSCRCVVRGGRITQGQHP